MGIKKSDLPKSVQDRISAISSPVVSKAARESKYHNVKTEVDGIALDSKKEASRWQDLKLLEKSGMITDLERQVKYDLHVGQKKICSYVADFTYRMVEKKIVEDCKGMKTSIYRLKKKWMKAEYDIDILET
jgi:Fe2+ transport system protein B